jgi:hypothetical protein
MDRANVDRGDLAPTIEQVLEIAVLKAGLMRKENFGDFGRVKWSRSSRTDKGVHSVATVIGLKVNVDRAHWHGDPEGLQLAASMNRSAFCFPGPSVQSSRSLARSWIDQVISGRIS